MLPSLIILLTYPSLWLHVSVTHLFSMRYNIPQRACTASRSFLLQAMLLWTFIFTHRSSCRQQKDGCTEKPCRLLSWNSCPLEVSLWTKERSMLNVLFSVTLLWVSQSREFWPVINSKVAVVQSLRHVRLCATPWTAVCQTFLSFTVSWILLRLTCVESVIPSNHLILCHPLPFLPSAFPRIRVIRTQRVSYTNSDIYITTSLSF